MPLLCRVARRRLPGNGARVVVAVLLLADWGRMQRSELFVLGVFCTLGVVGVRNLLLTFVGRGILTVVVVGCTEINDGGAAWRSMVTVGSCPGCVVVLCSFLRELFVHSFCELIKEGAVPRCEHGEYSGGVDIQHVNQFFN